MRLIASDRLTDLLTDLITDLLTECFIELHFAAKNTINEDFFFFIYRQRETDHITFLFIRNLWHSPPPLPNDKHPLTIAYTLPYTNILRLLFNWVSITKNIISEKKCLEWRRSVPGVRPLQPRPTPLQMACRWVPTINKGSRKTKVNPLMVRPLRPYHLELDFRFSVQGGAGKLGKLGRLLCYGLFLPFFSYLGFLSSANNQIYCGS